MVINKDKQSIQKFIKWLYRKYYCIFHIDLHSKILRVPFSNRAFIDATYLSEEEILKLIDFFWEEIE
jgi:hypothetical protein